jgi:hypothetical protein
MVTDSIELESYVEPHFVFLRSKLLTCPEGLSADRYLSHINYRILENPANLVEHVRKIHLFQNENLNQKKLTAALADLFFVLKTGGYALRKRLLLTSRELIDSEIFDHLAEKLKNGKLSISENWLSELPTLMVEKTTLEIVQKQTQEPRIAADDKDNAMRLADEYIENSQIDLAIETLEEAVLKTPGDDQPAKLLIELYRQTAEYDRFQTILQKLYQTHHETLPDCWQMASIEFEQS